MTGFIVELPNELSAPGSARRALGAELVGHGVSLGKATVETAMLVVSELVTNAVVHGSEPIRLTVEIETALVSLAVADAAEERPLPKGRPVAGQVGGWGLELVDRVSQSWGVMSLPDEGPGKVVWARIDL